MTSRNRPLCSRTNAGMSVPVGARRMLSANVFPIVSGCRKAHTKLSNPKLSNPHSAIIAPIAQLPNDASSAAAIGGTAPSTMPPMLYDTAAPV